MMEINTLRASAEIGVMVPEASPLAQEDKEEILSRIEELRYRLESDFPHIAFFFKAHTSPQSAEAAEEGASPQEGNDVQR